MCKYVYIYEITLILNNTTNQLILSILYKIRKQAQKKMCDTLECFRSSIGSRIP